MKEFHLDIADFLRRMPKEFKKRRHKFLKLAKECGCDHDWIRHYDQESIRKSIFTTKAYEVWFRFYLFACRPPILKRERKEFATCDGCFFDGKDICYSEELNLPMCAGVGENIIFVLDDE